MLVTSGFVYEDCTIFPPAGTGIHAVHYTVTQLALV